MTESGADFSITIHRANGNVKARISRIKRISQYSVLKGQNLDDSDPIDDIFQQQPRFGAEKHFKEDFLSFQKPPL